MGGGVFVVVGSTVIVGGRAVVSVTAVKNIFFLHLVEVNVAAYASFPHQNPVSLPSVNHSMYTGML